jgi:hypothetical protein
MRTKVLLKLLKHSMSEIQRDHRLSRAILLALIEYQCLDGVDGAEAFRYFLLTIESEFIHDCDEDCQHRADGSDEDHSSSSSSSGGGHVGHVCADVSSNYVVFVFISVQYNAVQCTIVQYMEFSFGTSQQNVAFCFVIAFRFVHVSIQVAKICTNSQ